VTHFNWPASAGLSFGHLPAKEEIMTEERNPSDDRCPVCGSEQFEGHSIDFDGGIVSQEMTCQCCRASWQNRYSYDGPFAIVPDVPDDVAPDVPDTEPPVDGLAAKLFDMSRGVWCYYVDPSQTPSPDGYIPSIVFAGQGGHFPCVGKDKDTAPWYWGDTWTKAEKVAREANQRRGISEDLELLIIGSSMNPTFTMVKKVMEQAEAEGVLQDEPTPCGS